MEAQSRAVRDLSPRKKRRLEAATQAVIESALVSNSATGLNWRRLASVTISEHYLVEYPELSNQEIALREILEELERRVIDHGVDLARLDNAELQGTIKDVLSDILDLMVHDAQASSSSGESDTDSSSTEDSDEESDSSGSTNALNFQTNNRGTNTFSPDLARGNPVHQGRYIEHPHEAELISHSLGASPSVNNHPPVDPEPERSSASISVENTGSSIAHGSVVGILGRQEETSPSPRTGDTSDEGLTNGTSKGEEKTAICCSTM